MESGFLYACGYGHLEIARFLLDRGVDSGLQNNEGQTGLHWAAYGGDIEMVKLLLQRGSPVDIRDRGSRATPLEVALFVWIHSPDEAERERCYDVVALLVLAGAKLDPEQLNRPGQNRSEILARIRSDPRTLAALGDEMTAE